MTSRTTPLLPVRSPLPRALPALLGAALALLALLLLLALPASAHTELEATVPEDGADVADPPVEVVLDFTSALLPGSEPAVRVLDPNGDDLVAAPPTLDGATVTVPLNLAVTPGVHTVDWAITAADGDDQTGSFTFTFAPPADVATPPGAVVETATPTATPPVTASETPAATPTSEATTPATTPEDGATDDEGATEDDTTADDAGDDDADPVAGILVGLGAIIAVGAVLAVYRRRATLLED